MKITPDAVKQFVSLRDSMVAEREQLITRLREIDEALGARGGSRWEGSLSPEVGFVVDCIRTLDLPDLG